MKAWESFLTFFYILDQGYQQCHEDHLGGFLGAISPELWGDGHPIDMAIFYEWQEFCSCRTIDVDNIIEAAYDFMAYYQRKYGLEFSKTKQWLLSITNKAVAEKAYHDAQILYKEYRYDD